MSSWGNFFFLKYCSKLFEYILLFYFVYAYSISAVWCHISCNMATLKAASGIYSNFLNSLMFRAIFDQTYIKPISCEVFYCWKYTECKKKRNTKFDTEFQNWIYFHNFITTWKFNQSLIMIWLTMILNFKSRQKAGCHYAITHTKSEENPLSKVWSF